jgi:hypothetical protein
MKKFCVFIFVGLLLLSLPVMAQDNSKVEVFGGYQYLHIGNNSSAGLDNSQGFNGWGAAAQYNFNKNFGVEGEFGGAYATVSGVNFHIYDYTGGPVVFTNVGSLKPFAHVLFGGTKLSGSQSGVSISFNGFTTLVGGGLDVRVNKSLAVRLAQFDWLYYHYGSKTIGGTTVPSFSGSNNIRIATGVVFRF